jgi:hypothetical protein
MRAERPLAECVKSDPSNSQPTSEGLRHECPARRGDAVRVVLVH